MTRIAVFARNHIEYLREACIVGEKNPSQPVTFRSAIRWARAKSVLDKSQLTLQVYFSPTGSKAMIEYEATLKVLVLDPKAKAEDTKAWLAFAPEDADSGELWENDASGVKTLYVVTNCRKLLKSFPISALRKASDGKAISENYGYSYIPVFELVNDFEAFISPEEINFAENYPEGATRTITVNSYERNPQARAACIQHYGAKCCVCKFSFGTTYGQIGLGFIHVHHLTQMSTIEAEYEVDPIADLRPVCPNCHAMLHTKTPPYSLQELASTLSKL